MVTYDFYQNTYLGNKIEGSAFPELAARAEEFVALLERRYQVKAALTQGREMAICAVAESLAGQPAEGISAASVGTVRVQYGENRSVRKELYRAVSPYLDICRGVV